jgi:hypothetical protein
MPPHLLLPDFLELSEDIWRHHKVLILEGGPGGFQKHRSDLPILFLGIKVAFEMRRQHPERLIIYVVKTSTPRPHLRSLLSVDAASATHRGTPPSHFPRGEGVDLRSEEAMLSSSVDV